MSSISQKDLDWLKQSPEDFRANLHAIDRSPEKSAARKSRFLWRLIRTLLLIPVVLGLPFFVLVRFATFIHGKYDVSGWLSLGAGVICCITLLVFYLLFLTRKSAHRTHLLRYGSYISMFMVLSFTVYGLFYLSGVHSKSEEVSQVYRSMHPILRVSVTTASLADQNLLITDIKRTPEDYLKWGLSPLQRSMHYPQADGFVYAVDLRTIGHSELRNKLLEYGFRAIGLHTLRHVGTADHLHVALKK